MKKKCSGYSLLELLIALALSLFLSNILINIFIQCKKTYYLIQGLDKVRTRLRIAFNFLSYDIRMAGLIGCVRLLDFSPLNSQLTPATSLIVWQEGHSTAEFILPFLPHAIPHSDIILMRSLDPNTVSVEFAKDKQIFLSGPERPLFHSSDKLLISDCQHAEVFQWGHINLKYTYQRDSEVGFLDAIVYYIGDTRRLNRKGEPIYALFRRNLNKSLSNPIELVEGITKMSVRLGVKKGSHLVYMEPNQVKNWFNVCNLEINLVLSGERSMQREWKHIIALRERGI